MSVPRVLVVDTERVWRGGQVQILTLIQGVTAEVDFRVACPADNPLASKVREQGLNVEAFSQSSEFSVYALWRILRLIRSWRPHLLHFNTPRPILAGCLAARFLRPRPMCLASRRVVFRLASPLSRFKYSHLLDLTLTVSDSIRQVLIEAGVPGAKVRTVYEGVKIEKVSHKASEHCDLVVGTVGQLSHEKGQDTLLQAAALLISRVPRVRFVFIGEGAERNRLETLARELGIERQVEFTGFQEDAARMVADFDIFCLPSFSEGLSSALLEAMAAGCPVVVTDVGGNPELVVNDGNGFLVPPRDPEALAKALFRLLESEDLRRNMGRLSRKRVEDKFSLQTKISCTLEAYLELLTAKALR